MQPYLYNNKEVVFCDRKHHHFKGTWGVLIKLLASSKLKSLQASRNGQIQYNKRG